MKTQSPKILNQNNDHALNRLKRRDEAEQILNKLIEERGPSSETLGLLGRVYKDHWDDAKKAGDELLAEGYLEKAIDTYLAGFEADWRDAYPGINAATLMNLRTRLMSVERRYYPQSDMQWREKSHAASQTIGIGQRLSN